MYHYTESGLRNVWLENGVMERKTAHGMATAVQDVEGLHKVIGRALAQKSHLTGAEFRFLRKELDLSQHRLADLIGTTEQSVALWERHGKIPGSCVNALLAVRGRRLKINGPSSHILWSDAHSRANLFYCVSARQTNL